MSLASRAVALLQKQYEVVFRRMRQCQWSEEYGALVSMLKGSTQGFLPSGRVQATAPMEALEPRMLMTALYWDVSAEAGIQGGSGTWSTGIANWNTAADGSGERVAWIDGSDAVFASDSPSLITVSGSVIACNLLFTGSQDNTVSGASLTMEGSASITATHGWAWVNCDITGNVTLNGNSFIGGTITGNVILNDNSWTESVINGNAVLNDQSWLGSSIVNGNVNLNDKSYCYGTINGNVVFEHALDGVVTFSANTAWGWGGYLAGTAEGTDGVAVTKWIFDDYCENDGTINGDVVFNDRSSNYSSGTVIGSVAFNDFSINWGKIFGDTVFNNQSWSVGTINGNVAYTSALQGTIRLVDNERWGGVINGTIVGGDGATIHKWIFSDYSWNEGIIAGDATFDDYSQNYGVIVGDAIFNNNSSNDGAVHYTHAVDLSGRQLAGSGQFIIDSGVTATNNGGLSIDSSPSLTNNGTFDWQTTDDSQLSRITNNGIIYHVNSGITAVAGQDTTSIPLAWIIGAGSLSDYTASIDWGDGTISTAGTIVASTNPDYQFQVMGSHTYANAGEYNPGVALLYNGSTAASISSRINVAPTLLISGANNVQQDSLYTLNLSATNLGQDVIHSWNINWGDGSDPDNDGVVGQIVQGNPSSITHVYTMGGQTYTIAATATNEDGTYTANGLNVHAYLPISVPTITNITPDTGASSSDAVTSATHLSVLGTGQNGRIVTVYANGIELGQTIVDQTGHWIFDANDHTFAAGSYILTAIAEDASGNSSNSSPGFTIHVISNSPAGPSSLAVENATTNSVTLSWTAPSGTGPYIYTIYRGGQAVGTSTTTTFTDTDLTSNTTYSYTVDAVDSSGNHSAVSTDQSAITNMGPATTPSDLQGSSSSSGTIDLSWTDSSGDASGFVIMMSTDQETYTEVGRTSGSATSFKVGNLQPVTTYYFKVYATNEAGDSDAAEVAVTTQDGVETPKNFKITKTSVTSVELTWDAADPNDAPIDYYQIEMKGPGDANFRLVANNVTGTSFSYGGMTRGEQYAFRIRAHTSVKYSDYANDTITLPGIEKININADAVDTTSIAINWSAPANSSEISTYRLSYGNQSLELSSSTTQYTVSNLTPSYEFNIDFYYGFRIEAYDSTGALIASGDTYSATSPDENIDPPSLFDGLSIDSSMSGVYYQMWNENMPENVRGAEFHITGPNIDGTGQNDVIWGPYAWGNYFYRAYNGTYQVSARVFNEGGWSDWSGSKSVQVTLAPSAPSALSATVLSDHQIRLDWNASIRSSDADSPGAPIYYEIYYSVNGETYTLCDTVYASGDWGSDGSAPYPDTTYTLSGLNSETKYSFKVVAVQPASIGFYCSDDSNIVEATTNPDAPLAPTGFSAAPIGSTAINLSWNNTPNNETKYVLEYAYDDPNHIGQPGTWQELQNPDADITQIQVDSIGEGKVQPAERYYFRLKAVTDSNDGGNLLESDYVYATVTMPPVPKCPTCGGGSLLAPAANSGQSAGASSSDGATGVGNGSATIVSMGGGADISYGTGSDGGTDGSAPDSSLPTLRQLHDGVVVAEASWFRVYFSPVLGQNSSGVTYVTGYTDLGLNPFHLAVDGNSLVLTDDSGNSVTYAKFSLGDSDVHRMTSYRNANGDTMTPTGTNSDGTPTGYDWTSSDGNTDSYAYTYGASGSSDAGLVTQIVLTSSGSLAPRQILSIDYYHDGDANGQAGNIRLTTLTTTGGSVEHAYLRYNERGQLTYKVSGSLFERLVADYGTDLDAISDTILASYSDRVVTYNSAGQISSITTPGEGVTTFDYVESANADAYNNWKYRRTEKLPGWNNADPNDPDNVKVITYSNYLGQTILKVTVQVATGKQWMDYYRYDSKGREILHANSSAITGCDQNLADLVGYNNGNATYLADHAGLIEYTDYYTSTTATSSVTGAADGYLKSTAISQGDMGTLIYQTYTNYIANTVGNVNYYWVANDVVFSSEVTSDPGLGSAGARTTHYDYTWFAGTNAVQSQIVTLPTISIANNGSGVADVAKVFNDSAGRTIWTMDADGYINYIAYDSLTGAVTKTIADVNYAQLTTAEKSSFDATGWSHHATGLNLTTTYVVDSQGRTIKQTDPNGIVTYTVYNDAQHEVRTYFGWDSTTHQPTGPVTVYREDIAGGYAEELTYTWSDPAGLSTDANGVPTGGESLTDARAILRSLSRTYTNVIGQVVRSDSYLNVADLTYSTDKYLGTQNINYYTTTYGYDSQGRQNRTISPTGTITRIVYDALGRQIGQWIGTNDSNATDADPTGGVSGVAAGNNMVELTANQYDNGGAGDGLLTQVTQYPHDGTANHVTQYAYDWRDRQIAVKTGVQANETGNTSSISFVTYNNAGETLTSSSYAADGVALTAFVAGSYDSYGNLITPNISSAKLRSYSTAQYDEQGRTFHTAVYSVNPSTGAVSSTGIVTNTWYDHRGQVIETQTSGSAATKVQYDGAGRTTVTYTTDGGAVNNNGSPLTSWAAANTVAGDIVLNQVEYTYDNNGNVLLIVNHDRYHDALNSQTGALGDPGSTGSTAKARVSYQAEYYDAAGRRIADVNVGTNGGVAYTRPADVPDRSDTALITSYAYNVAGMMDTVTDAKGIASKTYYDALGRTLYTVAAWDGSYDPTTGALPPSDSQDQTTGYTYDAAGHQLTMTAMMPSGTNSQTTQYVYGVSQANGSSFASNDVLRLVKYPDKATGQASTSAADQNSYTYNALGQLLTKTDQNGTVHSYTYDAAGRQTSDIVTLAAGNPHNVSTAVMRIDTSYNSQGQVYQITSYADATGTQIVSQIQREYSGLGQLTTEYQSTSGAVDTTTTPKVQYAYSDLSSGSRLISMTYPNGRMISYNYNAGLDGAIGRLSSITDSTGVLESYTYLGAGTIVVVSHPQTGISLTYVQQSGDIHANTDGGDQYTGLDRFGRVIDQNWVTASGTNTDRYQYTHDRNGNVTAKNNLTNSAYSEVYTYDNLNRLTSTTRNGTAYQSWNLDALGNSDITTNGSTEDRNFNSQNQIVGMSYDANGNTLTDEAGHQYVYDAWNHLVQVKDASGNILKSYAYDGLARRVTETTGSGASATTTTLYYSAQWQVIEENITTEDSSTTTQYVWSPTYIDAMICRDQTVTTTSGSTTQRIYAIHDANFNVTAIADSTGQILERYAYDAYGKFTILNADGNVKATQIATVGWQYLHQGGRYDATTSLYNFRNRDYNPDTQRWMQQDPMGYVDGASRYQYVGNAPIDTNDFSGLQSVVAPFIIFDQQNRQRIDDENNSLFDSTKEPPSGYTRDQIREYYDQANARSRDYVGLLASLGYPLASQLFEHFRGRTGATFTVGNYDMSRLVGTDDFKGYEESSRTRLKRNLRTNIRGQWQYFRYDDGWGWIEFAKPGSKFKATNASDMFYSFHRVDVKITYGGNACNLGNDIVWKGWEFVEIKDEYIFQPFNTSARAAIPGDDKATDFMFWVLQEYGRAKPFHVQGSLLRDSQGSTEEAYYHL